MSEARARSRRAPRPLRIALLAHALHPRGGVIHVIELAEALQAAGHDVTVVAPARPGERLFRNLGCDVELAPVPAGAAPEAASGPALRRQVRDRIDACVAHLSQWERRAEIDVWHAHDGVGGNALSDMQRWGLVAPHAACVRTVHRLDRFDDAVLMGWQARGWRTAHRLLCLSRGLVEQLDEDHDVIAHHVATGLDTQRWLPPAALDATGREADRRRLAPLGLREGAQIVLAVGGVEARKNTLRLLQAFARLQRRHPADRQLVIAGGAGALEHAGYRREFDAVLAASGLRPGHELRLTGPVDDDAMPALMRRADLLAQPSLREAFGLVVLEALACGTPALASHIEAFTEPFAGEALDATGRAADGVAGAGIGTGIGVGAEARPGVDFVDPLDVGAIAAGLARGLARGRRAARGAAVERLCDRHAWSVSAGWHLREYEAALAARAPRDAQAVGASAQGTQGAAARTPAAGGGARPAVC